MLKSHVICYVMLPEVPFLVYEIKLYHKKSFQNQSASIKKNLSKFKHFFMVRKGGKQVFVY